jgi:hypothetical protein
MVPNLTQTTLFHYCMIGRRILRTLGASFSCALIAAFGSLVNSQAAPQNIAFVSFHSADDNPTTDARNVGFTLAPDVEYTRLLRAAGHNVTRYVTTGAPDVAKLNTNDLIIISRSVPSGDYELPEETALWNGITKPVLILGGYILRNNRLGFTIGGTMVDTDGPINLSTTVPNHPIFTGVSLDGNGVMVNPFTVGRITYNGTLQEGVSVNTDPIVAGEVIATVSNDTDATFGGTIIAELPAGTVMGNATPDTLGGKRLIFLTGSREAGITSQAAGIWDLTTDGARMYLNAVHYLTGQPLTEPPPIISNLRPANNTALHLAELGMSFTASSGTAGGIPTENITLMLNGTNVPASELTITGTAQQRNVAFSNLVSGVQYTGTITVRDSSAREATLSFAFDTLDPEALPTSFAFPIAAAVPTSSGMRARFAQGPVSPPDLANTLARAEAQLAGTLIDPNTGQPYFNEAISSQDNPDGSFNVSKINWSVEAGLGVERGSFQAPTNPDEPFPGTTHANNFAVELITYLELQPGRYYMGVNSDDGFAVFAGENARDMFAPVLGRFDGGRGATDSIFQFRVTQAGLYPFRLVYYQGGGTAGNLEWFMMNPLTGEKILINDTANASATKAWRQINVGERPYVSSISPADNAVNVPVASPIVIKVEEPGATIQANTIQLTVAGQTVVPQVAKAGTTTTITYDGAQNLPSETTVPVVLTFTDSASSQRTVNFDFTTEYVPPVIDGANIVWVSFHPADDQPSGAAATAGFTNAADIEYTRLLTNAGHTVTRYTTTATPDTTYLQTFDLVIVSRSNPSGNFQNAASTAWHSLTNPVIHLGGYALRANRMGFFTGDTIPDTAAASVRLNVKDPTHPIFAGIDLDASSNMIGSYSHIATFYGTGAAQRGISVNNNPVATGGKQLATVSVTGDPANNGTVIAEYQPGTTMANAAGDVNAGHTLVFLTGSRENAAIGAIPALTSEGAGIFDLDPDGAKMFLNAVAYMAGLEGPTPSNITLSTSRASNGDLVITWPEAGAEGYVLQGSDSLGTPNWQPVGGTPTDNGSTLSQAVPTSGTMRFFRLRRP